MTPYQFLNANNQSLGDLSYNDKAKAYIDSLLANPTITHNVLPIAYARDENGILTNTQAVNDSGQGLYQTGSGDDSSYTTNPYDRTYLNGYEVSPAGENRYSVGIDDPTTRGLFDINAEIDPLTNKLKNLGTTYNSHKAFDWSTPAMFAALVGGGLLAAPYLGGASVLGEGALAGGGVASGEAVGGALGAEGGGAVGGTSGGFGSGTSLSADAASNPLNPFYGTANPAAQANLVGSNLVGGGAEANLGLLGGNSLIPVTGAGIGGAELGATGGIIGSGAGLGQSSVSALTGAAGLNGFTPSDFMSQPASDYNYKLPSSSKTPQQQMANALRLPTNLDTSVQVYNRQNPFLTNTQQTLANMLKV